MKENETEQRAKRLQILNELTEQMSAMTSDELTAFAKQNIQEALRLGLMQKQTVAEAKTPEQKKRVMGEAVLKVRLYQIARNEPEKMP
jgi:hypothetical protein